jgi:flagellar hook-associated protein 2
VVSAISSSLATSGTHTIKVTQLATTSSVYSGAIAEDTSLASGTLTFTVGGEEKQVTIGNTSNTLATLAMTINSQDLGVAANVISDSTGSRLVLVSQTSGTDGAIAITGGPSELTFQSGTAAQNAKLQVDGVSLEKSSNTIQNVIPGVTLNLSGTSSSDVSLTIAPDGSGVTTAIENFVNAYNSILGDINTQCSYNSVTESTGVLASDGAVTTLQSMLLSQMSFKSDNNSTFSTLRSLGIQMQNDGTLTIASDTLNAAIMNNYSGLQSFFQDSKDGFAVKFSSALTDLTSSTAGVLNVDIKGLNTTYESLTKQISDFEDRLASKRERLIVQYTKINATLSTMQSNLDSIKSLMDSLNTSNN